MTMTQEKYFEHTPLFTTERLSVSHAMDLYLENQPQLTAEVIELLTPEVVKTLPDEWHGITNTEQAHSWLQARFTESDVLMIHNAKSQQVIGFMFTHDAKNEAGEQAISIGYLLGQPHWRQGYGSEAVGGLVEHYKDSEQVKTLYAGVEIGNIGSIRVLEKNGFDNCPELDKNRTLMFKLNFEA